MRAIGIGLLASFFFASTFIINRAMDLSGGSWIWSASLRYLFMVPFLFFIVLARNGLTSMIAEMKKNSWKWLLWSFVGFVLFYGPICFAAAYSPAWLVAATWQFTIIAGSLLVPIKKIPFKGLSMSTVILIGILLMQGAHATHVSLQQLLFGAVPVLVASFAYPLGNRKMMELTAGRIDAYQRILGMTLMSVPFWLALSAYGWITVGLPTIEQTGQTVIVALSSGVIATSLFFSATDMARGNAAQLASVEATQAGAVLFTALGEVWLLSETAPHGCALLGMILVVLGMVLHSFYSRRLKYPLIQGKTG